MLIPYNQLEGVALAWAVANRQGIAEEILAIGGGLALRRFCYTKRPSVETTGESNDTALAEACYLVDQSAGYNIYMPHEQHGGEGGRIIERERISVEFHPEIGAGGMPDLTKGYWSATHPSSLGGLLRARATGPTHLTAAMRAYVASGLPMVDTPPIDVPDTLSRYV